ncbi:hypothetical protein [Amaricoccus sp.]|uniref:hypothetical protein n=1 Tax=Amaricoccus sp. TaxID=1872485 RepID=UPI002602FDAD|nr:hypothetical protein [uncultured Amaricoccus sp.]
MADRRKMAQTAIGQIGMISPTQPPIDIIGGNIATENVIIVGKLVDCILPG